MNFSNLIVIATALLLTKTIFAVPLSDHATSYQEYEGEPASRIAKVPGLTKPGQQLPLFPKPPVLLATFSSRGPKWKKVAANYIYDNFSDEVSYSWELSNSLEAINANKCNGHSAVKWNQISDDYIDDMSTSWESVKVEKQSLSSSKKGTTVLYIITLEAYLVYDYTDANDNTASYNCTVPVNKFVIKNKKLKSVKDVENNFLGILN